MSESLREVIKNFEPHTDKDKILKELLERYIAYKCKDIDIQNYDSYKLKKILLTPQQIKEHLDKYVIGQDYAKKILSVAVYHHYRTLYSSDLVIKKNNILMFGPTGSGKTYLLQTLAKIMCVPFAPVDASSLTSSGYFGEDVCNIFKDLIHAAEGDIERAEKGIIYIDEADKIAKRHTSNESIDVGGEKVQQELLKIIEGRSIEIGGRNEAKIRINTEKILFIFGGAFIGLEDIINKRIGNNKSNQIGFGATESKTSTINPYQKVEHNDIIKYGMIPEFMGRVPIVTYTDELTKNQLVKILTDAKESTLKSYENILMLEGVKLEFKMNALELIAEKAMAKKLGARALDTIISEIMLEPMYEIPSDETIRKVTITRGVVEGKCPPKFEYGKARGWGNS